MTELPAEKVLKEILTKLKTKTISSKARVSSSVKAIQEQFEGLVKTFGEGEKKVTEQPLKDLVERLALLIRLIDVAVRQVVSQYEDTLSDMSLYVESLESYSVELDKTLNDIFEQARKNAEEEIQKQKELMPKKDDSYIK